MLTCVSLNPPGFELYDGVGRIAAVLFFTATPDGVAAQIQVVQDAQWTDLTVAHARTPHHEGQTPGRHRGKNQSAFKDNRKTRGLELVK